MLGMTLFLGGRCRSRERATKLPAILFAQSAQTPAEVARIKSQGVADVQEGKDPRAILRDYPLPCFIEELAAARIFGISILPAAAHCVFEYGDRETAFAVHWIRPAAGIKVLAREK